VSQIEARERRAGCLWPLAAAAAAVLAACLGVLLGGRKSLAVDEAVAVSTAARPFRDLLDHVVSSEPGQAVYLLLLHPVVRAEDSEWAVRLPSAAASVLAVALAYALGTRLFGRLAGLTTAFVLATAAGVVAAAQQVRPYTLALLGIVLSSLLLVRAFEHGSTGRWIAYAASAAALPLLHPAAAAALGAQAVAAVVQARGAPRRLGGPAVGLAVALPFLVAVGLDRADAPGGSSTLSLSDVADGIATGLGWNFVLLGVGAVGVGLAAAGRVPGAALWSAVLAGGLALAPLAALLVAALAFPVHGDRVLVLATPGLALGVGAAVAALSARWATVTALILSVAALATLALWYLSGPVEDWKGATRAVAARQARNETVVIVPARAEAAVAYYAPGLRTWRRAYGAGAWVLVQAGSDAEAITQARAVVTTPRYALAEQRSYGDDLRLQHWVHP
jgi:mannosyltransferase